MHTLFALEDLYGLTIENKDGNVTFRFDPRKGKDAAHIADMVTAWADVSAKYRNGDMTRDDYDTWRYSYPAYDKTQNYVKIPSQELSDALVEAYKEK